MMRDVWGFGGVAVLALIAACADESAIPTQPAAPTVQSVTVTGPDALVVGATAAFAATAAYSDGSSNAATVTWQAMPSAVCSVTANGVVSATAPGGCNVSAALGGVGGSKSVTINEQPVPPPTLHVITGVVREIAPLNDAAVRGAAIIPLGGTLDGQRFETDAAGRFTLPAVSAAGFRLQVKHDDFENEYVEVRDLAREAFFEVAMTPVIAAAGIVHESAPTTHVPVGAATIEVIGGALAGSRFTADAAGGFTIRSSAPGLRLRFTAEGYQPREVEIPQRTRDSALDIALSPEPGNVVARFSGANWCQQPHSPRRPESGEARILGDFAVHHSGTVTIPTRILESRLRCVEFCDLALVRRLSSSEWEWIPIGRGGQTWWDIPVDVRGGYMYSLELRATMTQCGPPGAGWPGSPFDLRLIHPR